MDGVARAALLAAPTRGVPAGVVQVQLMGKMRLLDLNRVRNSLSNSEVEGMREVSALEAFTLGLLLASVRQANGNVAIERRSMAFGFGSGLVMGAITHLTQELISNAGDALTDGVCSYWLLDQEAVGGEQEAAPQ